jgi:hypothetical protein
MKKDPKNALKKVLALFFSFVLAYALLRGIIAVSEYFREPYIYYIGTSLYALSACALFIAYYILNGYKLEKGDRTIEELPKRWSDEKKALYMKKQPERRALAKKLIYIILPVVVSILISYIELNFFG